MGIVAADITDFCAEYTVKVRITPAVYQRLPDSVPFLTIHGHVFQVRGDDDHVYGYVRPCDAHYFEEKSDDPPCKFDLPPRPTVDDLGELDPDAFLDGLERGDTHG